MSKKRMFWQAHVTGLAGSRLGPTAYCREHRLDVKRFAYWRRILGSGDVLTGMPALIPIRMQEVSCASPRVAIHLLNGLQVHVEVSTQQMALMTLIRELSSC